MLKTPIEMIAEWKKGCTCGGPVFDRIEGNEPGTTSPAECAECTAALIDALEHVLREPSIAMIEAGRKVCLLPGDPDLVPAIYQAMVAEPALEEVAP